MLQSATITPLIKRSIAAVTGCALLAAAPITVQAQEAQKPAASIFKLVNVHSSALAYYVKCRGKTVSLNPEQEALLVQNAGYIKTLMANQFQSAIKGASNQEVLGFIVSADEGIRYGMASLIAKEGCESGKLKNFPAIVSEVVSNDIRQQLIDSGTPADKLPPPVEPGIIKKKLENLQ